MAKIKFLIILIGIFLVTVGVAKSSFAMTANPPVKSVLISGDILTVEGSDFTTNTTVNVSDGPKTYKPLFKGMSIEDKTKQSISVSTTVEGKTITNQWYLQICNGSACTAWKTIADYPASYHVTISYTTTDNTIHCADSDGNRHDSSGNITHTCTGWDNGQSEGKCRSKNYEDGSLRAAWDFGYNYHYFSTCNATNTKIEYDCSLHVFRPDNTEIQSGGFVPLGQRLTVALNVNGGPTTKPIIHWGSSLQDTMDDGRPDPSTGKLTYRVSRELPSTINGITRISVDYPTCRGGVNPAIDVNIAVSGTRTPTPSTSEEKTDHVLLTDKFRLQLPSLPDAFDEVFNRNEATCTESSRCIYIKPTDASSTGILDLRRWNKADTNGLCAMFFSTKGRRFLFCNNYPTASSTGTATPITAGPFPGADGTLPPQVVGGNTNIPSCGGVIACCEVQFRSGDCGCRQPIPNCDPHNPPAPTAAPAAANPGGSSNPNSSNPQQPAPARPANPGGTATPPATGSCPNNHNTCGNGSAECCNCVAGYCRDAGNLAPATPPATNQPTATPIPRAGGSCPNNRNTCGSGSAECCNCIAGYCRD